MDTDKLFSEFFRLYPTAVCELLHITPVLKSERAIDGLIEPVEPGHPFFFLEIQGCHVDKFGQTVYTEYVRFGIF